MKVQFANLKTRMADHSGRMDRRDEQMECVSRRPELTEASH